MLPAVCLLATALAGFPIQDDAKLDKYARDATRRNPMIRIQASRRLVKAGEAGLRAVERFIAKEGSGKLSSELVRALGQFEADGARALLRKLLVDDAFPWLPQVLAALAEKPRPEDSSLFEERLEHVSWLLRKGALTGTRNLHGTKADAVLRKALADSDPRVRVHAAALLLDGGSTAGLPVLVAGLDVADRFFAHDLGYPVRRAAHGALRKWAGKDFGYKPRQTWQQRTAAVTEFRKLVEAATGGKLAARSPEPATRAWQHGFERRSCREGDRYLRLDAEGRLFAGAFSIREIPVSSELRDRLRQAAGAAAELKRTYGTIRCDFTRYAGLGPDAERSVRCAPGQVPESLSGLAALWEKLLR